MPHTPARRSSVKAGTRNGRARTVTSGRSESLGRTEIVVPWSTIFRIVLAVALVAAAVKLGRWLGDFFLALLIGMALAPVVRWTRRHRWPDWSGVLLCTLLFSGAIIGFVLLVVPEISKQGGALIDSLPKIKAGLLEHLPGQGPVRAAVEQLVSSSSFSDPSPLHQTFLSVGKIALGGVVEFLLVMVCALYFVASGEHVFRWLVAFLPPVHRKKVNLASGEIAQVVGAYMRGQLITSLIAAAYVFTVLSIFHVPSAVLLAVLAGVFDVLPLIGFFLFLIPAVAAASMVSPQTALFVGLLYGAYHLIESYLIVPKIYGRQLRLSALTVLVCCLLGGAVAGVVGVIAILPIVASYPIVERHWLHAQLEPDTVEKHEELDGEKDQ